MQNKLTPRQVCAWQLCAGSVPAAMVLAGKSWLWVLVGSAAATLMRLAIHGMLRGTEHGLPELLVSAFGRRGGRIAAACELIWLLAAAAGAAGAAQLAFEDDLGMFAPAVPLLLAALAGEKGKASVGRVCGVLVLCTTILYGVIVLAAIRHVHLEWLRPQKDVQSALLAFCMGLTPTGLLFALDGKETAKLHAGWIPAAMAVPAVLAMLTAGCLSPEAAAEKLQPLHTMTKSLTVLSVMQRFEALLSVAELIGITALLLMIVCAANSLWGILKAGKERKLSGYAFCLLAFCLSGLTARAATWIWACGMAVFWGGIPILTLVIVNIKKE